MKTLNRRNREKEVLVEEMKGMDHDKLHRRAGGPLRFFSTLSSIAWLLTYTACCQPAAATAAAIASAHPSASSASPESWAAEATRNEIPIIEHREIYLRYQMHIVNEKGNQLRDVIESRDGTVARLIKRDDRPLTAEEDAAEQQRLQDLIASPASYHKHESNDDTGKKRAVELIQMFPDAMTFEYVAGQPQLESVAGEQIVLDFKPNPAWKPPNLTAEALTGLQGRVWIDRKTRHMVRMEGEIFQTVNLGWGMVARIYPGGRLALDQAPASTGPRWIFARFTEHLTVRALMVKTIHRNANVSTAEYQSVRPMSYQEAIRTLLATPLPR